MDTSREKKNEHLQTEELHVKNSLSKIATLLEEIKEQRNSPFKLKNLFIILILFALFLFSTYFTATKALCEKGAQVRIGYIRQLQAAQKITTPAPSLISTLLALFTQNPLPPQYILIRNNEDVIQISTSQDIDISPFSNYKVVISGLYNTCSNTMTINNPSSLEIYSGI